MAHLAMLDDHGILTGFSEGTPGLDRIEVPDNCDLEVGRYRWNCAAKRFDPLPRLDPWLAMPEETPEPDTLRAIARGFMAIRDNGLVALPPETLDWLDRYGRSIDNAGGN